MSDPISPAGSLGQVPQVATQTTSLIVSFDQDGDQATSPVSANTVQPATRLTGSMLPEADRLELSPTAAAAAANTAAVAAPKTMTVEDAAKAFQDYLTNLPSDLQFIPDAASGIVVFKVINPITQKVLRQYPPEEMLEVARNLRQALKESSSGILLDHNS